ncbi:MAG TPA: fibronectin type III domain-containing protein [Dissulfurispiraceae bacterium]|nr:fibronectin type III domain-containing protein [Dissulfurispiraceae bacterium]
MSGVVRTFLVCLAVAGVLSLCACGSKGQLTMRAYEKPEPVASLTAVHREDVVTLAWSYPAAERSFISGFIIERAEPGKPFSRVVLLPSEASSYIEKNYSAGSVYEYRVLAVSRKDRISDVIPPLRVAPRVLPAPPATVKAEVVNEGVELSWGAVGGDDTRYNVYRSAVRGACAVSAAVNSTPLPETKLREVVSPLGTVYYCVRSLYATPLLDEGFASAEVAVEPYQYVPGRVEDLRGIATPRGVQLVWRERPEQWVKQYRVYRKDVRSTALSLIGESAVPAFLDMTPSGEAASYTVEAVGPVVVGQRSAELHVAPLEKD